MRHLDTKYFRLASVLQETESLTLTGKHLHLSQPAISHQLKALEEFIGAPVFERRGKRMVANPAGRYLAEEGRRILQDMDSVVRETRALNFGSKGAIRIATACHTCYNWVPKIMGLFHQKYPDVRLEIKPQATANTHQHIIDDNIDIGLVNWNGNQQLHYQSLFNDEILLLVSKDNPLAKRKKVSVEDTLDNTWIFYEGTEEKYSQFLFQANNCPVPEHTTSLALTEVIIEWVGNGLGVCSLARWAAAPYLANRDDIAAIPLVNPSLHCRNWFAATLYQNPPESWQYFIQLLRENPPAGSTMSCELENTAQSA